MRLGKIAAAVVVSAGGLVAGCAAPPASTPAPEAAVSPVVAVAPPPSGWQWSDAGPAITLATSDVLPATAASGAASLAVVCTNSSPLIRVVWDAPVAGGGFTYRFDSQPAHEVAAHAAGPGTEEVRDSLAVSRFIDQAAGARQLVVRAGSAAATFMTADDAGNLLRFRTVCPDGTN